MLTDDRLEAVCAELAAAAAEHDGERIHQAIPRLSAAAAQAGPDEVQAAVATLAPVLADLPNWIGGLLALHVGELAHAAGDPSEILTTLVERSILALEDAGRFAELYGAAQPDLPNADDPSQVDAVVAQLSGAAPGEAADLVAAWFSAGWWLHPVLHLAQRKDVRQALPHRERLVAAATPREGDIEKAGWLLGLLRVLDDAPLVVLHRPSGRGFRVVVSGVADNVQLQTLLAARLIGADGEGLLPGAPPSAAEVSAATDGEPGTQETAEARFAFVDAYGKAVPFEGGPADIPEFKGVRVLVLDPPDGQSWAVGRPYPLMAPELTVHGELSTEEAASWLAGTTVGD